MFNSYVSLPEGNSKYIPTKQLYGIVFVFRQISQTHPRFVRMNGANIASIPSFWVHCGHFTLLQKKNMHVQRDQKMTHLEMLKRKSLPNGDMKLGSPVVDLPMGNAKKNHRLSTSKKNHRFCRFNPPCLCLNHLKSQVG